MKNKKSIQRDALEQSIRVEHIDIAIKRIGKGKPVVCLHGWLDNSASMLPLVDALGLADLEFILVDLPGHGLSGHRPPGVHQYFTDLVAFLYNLLDAMQIPQCALIGHSMGAGCCSLFAGAFPDRVESLFLIDGLGPISDSADQVVERFRDSLQSNAKPDAPNRIYKSRDVAIKIRQKAGDLSRTSAELLVDRGMTKHPGGYSWSYDTRLKHPSMLRLSEEQIHQFLKIIACPTQLVLAGDGSLGAYQNLIRTRTSLVKKIQVSSLDGGHHLHMENPVAVAEVFRPRLIAYRDVLESINTNRP